MKNWRIFWTYDLEESGYGWWYYHWSNWLTGEKREVFAGYNKRAIRSTSSAFKDLL